MKTKKNKKVVDVVVTGKLYKFNISEDNLAISTLVELFIPSLGIAINYGEKGEGACQCYSTTQTRYNTAEFIKDIKVHSSIFKKLEDYIESMRQASKLNSWFKLVTDQPKTKKIELVSQDEVNDYNDEIEQILRAINYPTALVTDESTIGDFMLKPKEIAKAAKKLKTIVSNDDYLIDIAKRIRCINKPSNK